MEGKRTETSEVPGLNPPPYCYLDLFKVVPSSTPLRTAPVGILKFSIFEIFSYLFAVSPMISTTVLYRYDA